MTSISVLDFIKSLSDTELKFLYYYKYSSYLDSSKKLIDDEIETRRINKNEIVAFISSYKPDSGCKKCSSIKIIENTKKCAVCGYESSDSDYSLLWDFIGIILQGIPK